MYAFLSGKNIVFISIYTSEDLLVVAALPLYFTLYFISSKLMLSVSFVHVDTLEASFIKFSNVYALVLQISATE